jgi:hypothetical protein
MKKLSLPRTKAALDKYDEVDRLYSEKMRDINIDNALCLQYLAVIEHERLVVCATFWEETKDRNHLDSCKCIQMNDPWFRTQVAKYG